MLLRVFRSNEKQAMAAHRLQVPMHDVQGVQVRQSQNNLGRIQPCLRMADCASHVTDTSAPATGMM